MRALQMVISSFLLGFVFFGGVNVNSLHAEDAYEKYVKTSKDFKRVKQDKDWAYKAWPGWVYMPWYFNWSIGKNDAGGEFSQAHGYNGSFTDHGNPEYLDWINKYKLYFYNDHTAKKGYLHIHPEKVNNKSAAKVQNRMFCMVDESLKSKLEGFIKNSINSVKSSPYRAAYSLDDEISWGSFIKACMWKITSDSNYRKWLNEIYGEGNAPANTGWISYDSFRKELRGWTLADFDCHQLMDQLTFNDSYWNNFLGDLVEYANSIDPATPVGFVGAQSPSPFGGYDYAKIMRKVQFLEAYGLDDTQNYVRSFNPGQGLPIVSTHFHKKVKDTIWQAWYSIAKGNRGHIGWVGANWFNGKTPATWHKEVAPHYKELANKIGPLMAKSTFIDDKVAIYYSHASFQMSWIMDSVSHGSTWPNRNEDGRLGTSHMTIRAWRRMLQDEGLQFTFVNYVDVIQKGIPKHFKVLILPAIYCLSEAEARQIRLFVKNGGTVIADFLPAVFDQHGKAHAGGGVLDDVFGVKQDMNTKQEDVFSQGLWVEVNQDANYSNAGKYKKFLTTASTCIKDKSGFNKAVANMPVKNYHKFGKGQAYLMNLSPQWYNAYRQSYGYAESAKKRACFMDPVKSAGLKRWVELENAGEVEFGYEISYWEKDGRTILFLVSNPDSTKSTLGGGNSQGLKTDTIDVVLKFNRSISDVRDERSGEKLKSGKTFKFKWKQNTAVVISFKGNPYE